MVYAHIAARAQLVLGCSLFTSFYHNLQPRCDIRPEVRSAHDMPDLKIPNTVMAVVPSSGDVIFLGNSNTADTRAIYAYVGEKKRWMVKNLKQLCSHTSGVHLLSLELQGREHLAVSCWECGNIRVQELYPGVGYGSKDSLKVLSHWRHNPGYVICVSPYIHLGPCNKRLFQIFTSSATRLFDRAREKKRNNTA